MAETSSSIATHTSESASPAGDVDIGTSVANPNQHGIMEESSRVPNTEEAQSGPPSTAGPVGVQNDPSSPQEVADAEDGSRTQPGPQKAQTQKTHFFGIPQGQGPSYPGFVNNNFDYYQKYPEDEWGEEWGENARVWKVYLDEAQIYDTETTEGWKDTLNVFLVFALQPDYAQTNAFLLMEQIALQRAIAKGSSPDTIAPATVNAHSPASPTSADLCVNGLWFLSLALSLCVALAAVVIKQWIQEYNRITSGTPKAQARVRQFRFAGLERWGVPVIIGILPVLLHAALFLFLVGLVIFTLPLNGAIGALTLALAAVTLGIYVTSMILSLVFLDCPYKTPIATHLHDLVLIPLVWALQKVYNDWPFYLRTAWIKFTRLYRCGEPRGPPSSPTCSIIPRIKTKKSREDRAIHFRKDLLDLSSVAWLHLHSSNTTASGIALESISSLPASVPHQTLVSFLPDDLEIDAASLFNSCFSQSATGSMLLKDSTSFSQMERLGRATARLASPFGHSLSAESVCRFLRSFVPQESQRSSRAKQLGSLGQIVGRVSFLIDGFPEDAESRSISLDLIRHGHPSLVAYFLRILLDTNLLGPDSSSLSMSQQNFALELFRRIPTATPFSTHTEETVFLQWSASVICSYLPWGTASGLPMVLGAFKKFKQAHYPNYHRYDGLAILLLYHTAHHLTDLLSSQEILEMMAPGGLLAQPALFVPFRGLLKPSLLALSDPKQGIHDLRTALRQISSKAAHQLPPGVGGIHAPEYLATFLSLFEDTSLTFEEEDLELCSALSASLKRSPILPYSPPIQITPLVRCLSCYLRRSTAIGTISNAELHDPVATTPLLERIHENSGVMGLLTGAFAYQGSLLEEDAEKGRWLGIYARSVQRAARLSSEFAFAFFAAIKVLLEDSGQHFLGVISYKDELYLVALLEKLKEMDPSCGGLENIDGDGISNMVVYKRLWKDDEQPACNQVNDPIIQAYPNRKVVTIDNEKWIVEPVENTLAHIFDELLDIDVDPFPPPTPTGLRKFADRILPRLQMKSGGDSEA